MDTEAEFVPILDLSPSSEKFAIKARVTSKSEIKTFTSAKGVQGKVFNVDLLDSSGAIRATAFGENVDKHYTDLEVGQVHEIRNFSVKMAKAGYSSIKHEYELQLTAHTQIRSCLNDDKSIPHYVFDFTTFDKLSDAITGTTVDVIGLCLTVGQLESVSTRRGETKKREIALVDQSSKEVMVTLWGSTAEMFQNTFKHHIVALKNVRTSDFSGLSLTSSSDCTVKIDPKITESKELQNWYDTFGKSTIFENLSTQQRTSSDAASKAFAIIREIENKQMEIVKIQGYINMKLNALKALWKETFTSDSTESVHGVGEGCEDSSASKRAKV